MQTREDETTESDMPTDRPSSRATDAVLLASRALIAVAAESLAELEDVTLPQFRALVVLSTEGRATVGALADALDIHSSTATRLCDRLVRKRLVRRERGRSDRRAAELTLTAAGHHAVDQVMARRRQAIARVVGRMTADERRGATASLGAFASAAGELRSADPLGWLGAPAPVGGRSGGRTGAGDQR